MARCGKPRRLRMSARVMAYCLVERENCDERLSFFADPKVENEVFDEKKW